MHKRSIFIAALMAFAAATVTARASPCSEHETGGALNFWIGEWSVASRDGETHYGTNVIEPALEGCAIFEHWRSARAGEGKSLFFFDAANGEWAQVWVTTDTRRPGGLKHKRLIESFDNGAVRFQGEYPDADGETITDRTTLTPNGDGTVRQHIEASRDGGKTWRTTFDALYTRNNTPNGRG